MGKDITEVRVGVDGIVATGVFGVAVAPTSADSVLDASWTDLGYVNEDGVTETTEQSTSPLKAWQRQKKVRTLIEEGSVRYQLILIQTNKDTVAFYYGGTVASDGSIVIDPTKERPVIAFLLDVIDGDQKIRAYAPEAQVIEVGDQIYSNGEPIGYEVTVEASFNESLGGAVKKWYSELTGADTWSLEITGSPTGGDFTLTADGETTAPIAYNAAAAAIATALNALTGIDGATVTGTTTKTITFAENVALTADDSGLTGGTTPAVVVAEV